MDKYTYQASLLQQQHLQQQQQFAERILEHLAFNSDILERWHQIGSTQGLSTDLEVATFLIQHYENTWDRAHPTEFCTTCHSPLTQHCNKCSSLPSSSSIPSSSNTNHDPLSSLFPTDNNALTEDPLSTKDKKRKKSKKSASNNTSTEITNDDELMGLCIQFGQPPLSSAAADHMAAPFEGKKAPGKKKSTEEKNNARKKVYSEDGIKLKSYICSYCGKTMYKLGDFNKHVRIHTREKPYKCQLCEAAFSDPSSMARHRRVHTGEKPFKCDTCPASFAQSSDLTKHMRVHTQERPWQCQICEKTFADSSQFAQHRRKHEKEMTRSPPKLPS